MSDHPSHSGQLASLNRAIGQLEAIKRMIADGRYCVDIMMQLRATRNAIKTIELGVLKAHMLACLNQSCHDDPTRKDQQIAEIITLLKKYE